MQVIVTEEQLVKRVNKIRNLLSVINKNLFTYRLFPDKNVTNFILKDSSTISNDYPYFKTSNDNLKASYQEIWKKNMVKDEWSLLKANFGLMVAVGFNDYKELMAFHNDFVTNKLIYKNIPHIHVKHPKQESVSNAHIALNLTDHEKINSMSDFDDNLKRVFTMINNEFILTHRKENTF